MSDSEKQKHEAADSEEQKRVDLARAQHRTLKRPGKKEKRFSEIDGRYVPPPELQKEIDKLVEAKAQAAQKKKGLLKLFKRDAPPLSPEEKNKEIAEKKRQTRQIRELRGMQKRTEDDGRKAADAALIPEEDGSQNDFAPEPKRSSFLKTVSLLNSESAKPDAYKSLIALPPQKKLPDGILVDEIAYPAGVIYWDAHDLLADRVVVIHRVLRHNAELLLSVYAPDTEKNGIIPANRIVRLYDLASMRKIEDAYGFVTQDIRDAVSLKSESLIDVLAFARYDLLLLAAASGGKKKLEKRKEKLFLDYVSVRCGAIAFDGTELLDYIKALDPDDGMFQEALDVLTGLPHEIATALVRTFLQLMLADGIMRPKQRELYAELLYALRCAGMDLNIMGLR